jgi:hypothetical protein
MQSFGEEYSAHYYLQYGVELIQWTIGSASGLGRAEGLSPEHCWPRSLDTFAPVKMRDATPTSDSLSSTILFRDSVITEHLGEWCAGYSLFSVQDLTSPSHMAESQTDTKVP